MPPTDPDVGAGLGVLGLGCSLLLGGAALGLLLVCGGVARSVWRSMPVVVEEAPLMPAPGTARPAAPVPPRPTRPKPARPAGPRPAKPSPTPAAPVPGGIEVEAETRLVAPIGVAGDPMLVLAIDEEGTAFPLPGDLPRGRYALEVTFAGRAPFEAGSVTVLDGSAQTVICRSSLAICKVQ